MPVEKFKNMTCKVLNYNESTKEIDIDFNGYGIRISNVNRKVQDTIIIKYRGEIGQPDFVCKV